MRFAVSLIVCFASLSSVAGPAGTSKISLKDIITVTQSEPVSKYVGSDQVISAACAPSLNLVDAKCTAELPVAMKSNFRELFVHEGRYQEREMFTNIKIVVDDFGKRADCRALNVRPQDVVKVTLSLVCVNPSVAHKSNLKTDRSL